MYNVLHTVYGAIYGKWLLEASTCFIRQNKAYTYEVYLAFHIISKQYLADTELACTLITSSSGLLTNMAVISAPC